MKSQNTSDFFIYEFQLKISQCLRNNLIGIQNKLYKSDLSLINTSDFFNILWYINAQIWKEIVSSVS